MLVLSVSAQALVERFVAEPGPLARGVAGVGALGAAVELFVYAERHPDSALGHAVHGPGHEIQRRVSTREPTADQMDVGAAALHEVLRVEREAADTV
jgi:uncharacterized protein YqhQ